MSKNKKIIKTNNVINILYPFRTSHGIWVYNDEDLGVYSEAFVCGSSEVIDAVVGKNVNNCIVVISSQPFPSPTLVLHKIEKIEEGLDNMLGWYRAEPLGMEHWLCSKILDYFPNYPETIYVKIDVPSILN